MFSLLLQDFCLTNQKVVQKNNLLFLSALKALSSPRSPQGLETLSLSPSPSKGKFLHLKPL